MSFSPIYGHANYGYHDNSKAHENSDEEVHIEINSSDGCYELLIATRREIFTISWTAQIVHGSFSVGREGKIFDASGKSVPIR